MDYIKDCEFRIKKMNAIEALALQTSSSMKNVDATHGRGTRPRVHTYVNGSETYDSPTIDWSTGNVTLHSNAQVAMKVLIY